jgi:hypothetical protein
MRQSLRGPQLPSHLPPEATCGGSPVARASARAGSGWWLVTREWPPYAEGTYAALSAKVHRGRVSAFVVYHQAGGD